MPTKRTRVAHNATQKVSPAVLSLVSEGLWPMPEDKKGLLKWKFFMSSEEQDQIMAQIAEPILAEWIRQRPGRRPQFWWNSKAPEKCRRRLAGIGDPAHEYLAYTENYEHGIPTIFLSKWDEDYYNGRARDIHGKLILSDFKEGDFAGHGVDPNDPPVYESEAAYLDRHGLLTPGEKRRLTEEDFKPQILVEARKDEDEEDEDYEPPMLRGFD
jgi:hypothetical protein